MLDNEVNYIVSGLERSGTSLMLQMLHAGGLPVAYDESRPADEHNPRGYYELAGGKIISRLMDGSFDIQSYKGSVIKVTAYGIRFLPEAKYRVIYMVRNIDEILLSMKKMGAEIQGEKDKVLFGKLNRFTLDLMSKRDDIVHTVVRYRDLMDGPREAMERVGAFLGVPFDTDSAAAAVDISLYRNRASSPSSQTLDRQNPKS